MSSITLVDEEGGGNDVYVVPGQCIAWRCREPADEPSIACVTHAKDFDFRLGVSAFLSAEERQYLATIKDSAARLRERKRLYMASRRRANPGYSPGAGSRDANRRRSIVAMLTESGEVFTADLAEKFGVSMQTIARDLVKLHTAGLCYRVYGGAKLDAEAADGLPSPA